MKWVRRGLYALFALVGLAIVGAVIFIATFDANAYKPRIQAEVEKATGRKMAINGDAALQFSLTPTVAVSDVHFANAAWSTEPEMAKIGTLEVQLSVLPLIDGDVVINRLVVEDATVRVETDKNGVGNWQFGQAPATAPAPAPTESTPAAGTQTKTPTIESITLEDTVITYVDGITKQTRVVNIESLTVDSDGPDSPMDIAFKGLIDNAAVEVDAEIGSLNALTLDQPFDYDLTLKAAGAQLDAKGHLDVPSQMKGLRTEFNLSGQSLSDLNMFGLTNLPSSNPYKLEGQIEDVTGNYRVKLKGNLGDTQASIDGTLIAPLDAPGFDGDISIEGKTLAELGGILAEPLPDLGPYSLAGHLKQMDKAYALDMKGTLASTNASVKGTLATPTTTPGFDGQIAADTQNLTELSPLVGTELPDLGPIQFTTAARVKGQEYRFENLTLALQRTQTQLAGNVAVSLAGNKPNITASLKSPSIDLGAFQTGAGENAGNGGGGGSGNGDGRVFSAEPLPIDWISALDGRIGLSIDRFVAGKTTIDKLVLNAGIANDRLSIEKFDGQMAGGGFSITGNVAAGKAPGVALKTVLRNMDAVQVQQLIGMDTLVTGSRINAAFDIKGSGNSPRAIMAGLNGATDLNISAGRINNRASEVLMADLGKLLTLGGGGDNSALNCMVNRFAIKNGQAVSQVFVADTGGATILGDGQIALDTERLSLKFAPKAKQANLVNFAVPVRVSGTLANPLFTPDPIATATGLAGAGLGIATGGGVGGAVLGYITGTGAGVTPGAGTDACLQAVSGNANSKPNNGNVLDDVVDGVGGAAEDVGNAIEDLFQ